MGTAEWKSLESAGQIDEAMRMGEPGRTADLECAKCAHVTPHEMTTTVTGAHLFACLRCRELDAEAVALAERAARDAEVRTRAQHMIATQRAQETVTPPAPASQPTNWPSSKVGALVGGVMLAVGAFLPWISISAFGTEISRSGVDLTSEDAMIMVIAGAAMAVLAVTGKLVGPTRVVCSLVGAGGGALTAFHAHQMYERVQAANAENPGMATVGYGLYVCAGGCLALLVAPWVKH